MADVPTPQIAWSPTVGVLWWEDTWVCIENDSVVEYGYDLPGDAVEVGGSPSPGEAVPPRTLQLVAAEDVRAALNGWHHVSLNEQDGWGNDRCAYIAARLNDVVLAAAIADESSATIVLQPGAARAGDETPPPDVRNAAKRLRTDIREAIDVCEFDPPSPPLHNLLMPHDMRYMDERGCPPNCPFREWAEKYLGVSSPDTAQAAEWQPGDPVYPPDQPALSPEPPCPHPPDAVTWNPYNQVTQCHRCGEAQQCSSPDTEEPQHG